MEQDLDAVSKENRRSWDESRPRLWRDQLRLKLSLSPLAAAEAAAPESRRFRRDDSDPQPIPAALPWMSSRKACAVRYKSPLLGNSSPCPERKFQTLDCCPRARPPAQGAFRQQPWHEHQRQLQRGFRQRSCCRQECSPASDLEEAN